MLEDFFDHAGLFYRSVNADPPLAAGAGLDVDRENPLQKPRPRHTLFAG